jgi:hypothetical protein
LSGKRTTLLEALEHCPGRRFLLPERSNIVLRRQVSRWSLEAHSGVLQQTPESYNIDLEPSNIVREAGHIVGGSRTLFRKKNTLLEAPGQCWGRPGHCWSFPNNVGESRTMLEKTNTLLELPEQCVFAPEHCSGRSTRGSEGPEGLRTCPGTAGLLLAATAASPTPDLHDQLGTELPLA